jgi:hypothetical protein
MKNIILAVLLFFVLTPGILLRLPNKGSKYVVAGVHAVVFGLLLWVLGKFVMNSFEGFEEGVVDLGKGGNSPAQVRIKEILDNATKIQNSLKKEFDKIVTSDQATVTLKNAYTKEYGDNLNAMKVKLGKSTTIEQVNNTSNLIAVKDHGKSFANPDGTLLNESDIVKALTDKVKAAKAGTGPTTRAAARAGTGPTTRAAARAATGPTTRAAARAATVPTTKRPTTMTPTRRAAANAATVPTIMLPTTKRPTTMSPTRRAAAK